MAKFKDDRDKYVSSLMGLSFTLMMTWLVLLSLFGDDISSLTTLNYAQLICLVVITWENAVFQAWSVRQRCDLRYGALIAITVAVSILRPLLGIVFVILFNGTAASRVFSMVIVDVLAYSGLFLVLCIKGRIFFLRIIGYTQTSRF